MAHAPRGVEHLKSPLARPEERCNGVAAERDAGASLRRAPRTPSGKFVQGSAAVGMVKLLIMYSNAAPSPQHVRRLEGLRPDVRVAVAADEASAVREAADADVFLGHRYLSQCLPHARRLRWLQSTAAGSDHLLTPALRAAAPIVTRTAIFSDVIALHALTMALALVRRIPDAVRAQGECRWAPQSEFDVLPVPRAAMVIGMGGIGSALGRRLKQNGIRVLAALREPRPLPGDCCDEPLAGRRWRERLGDVDLCFLAIPGSPDNRHFVGQSILAALPRHAVLVNVGRGATLDHAALLRQIDAGCLGGAGLDVLDEVPDAERQRLFASPRVLVTPKLGVFTPERQDRLEAYVESQVGRYLAGHPLLDPVDLSVPRDGAAAPAPVGDRQCIEVPSGSGRGRA